MALGIRLGLTRILKRVEVAGSSISPVTVLNGQTANLTTPPGSWTVGTILFSSIPTPNSINIVKGSDIYICVDGDWYDVNTEELSNDISIGGDFSVANNSGGPYTFWDIPAP